MERRADPNDRRARCLYIKDKAAPSCDEIWRLADETRKEFLRDLSARGMRAAHRHAGARARDRACASERLKRRSGAVAKSRQSAPMRHADQRGSELMSPSQVQPHAPKCSTFRASAVNAPRAAAPVVAATPARELAGALRLPLMLIAPARACIAGRALFLFHRRPLRVDRRCLRAGGADVDQLQRRRPRERDRRARQPAREPRRGAVPPR